MMILVRLIDLVVSVLRYLASPEGRLLRAGVLVVLFFGTLVGAVAIIWGLTQLPHYLAGLQDPRTLAIMLLHRRDH